jgi:hypothetical protein
MSLKGYEFLNDDKTKVVARFFFKDLSLFLYEEIDDKKMKEIKDYIKEKGFNILKIDRGE